jgi:hypothetical protein
MLDKKVLEFYKWEGSVPQLLQNVRMKLNHVSSVRLQSPFPYYILLFVELFCT